MLISISDKEGRIRSDFTEAELDSLTEAESAALARVIKSSHELEAVEEQGKQADADAAECAKALSEAEAEHRAALPKTDRITETRRQAETQRRVALGMESLPPLVSSADERELLAAIKIAEDALSAAHAKSYDIKARIKGKRVVLGDALTTWQRQHANTPEDLIREHLDRQQEINRKLAAEGTAPAVVVPTLSHLDAVLQQGKKTGANSINYGNGRKRW